ncbi:MAG: ABC-2 family transporter protein, partial [Erysipelotrichaceae bacterium]
VLGINHQIDISVLSLGLYVLSLGMGLFISFYANFIFANLVFYTDATFGMFQLNEAIVRIFSGSLIPLIFFPGWLKLIADFLPYGSIQYIPTMILMGRISGNEIGLRMLIQLAWVLSLALSAHLLWNHSLRRMKVHGG